MFYVLSRLVRTLCLILLHAHYPLLRYPKLCDLPLAIWTIFLGACPRYKKRWQAWQVMEGVPPNIQGKLWGHLEKRKMVLLINTNNL